eukprot:9489564-Pyramimonas_sp.AAC.1
MVAQPMNTTVAEGAVMGSGQGEGCTADFKKCSRVGNSASQLLSRWPRSGHGGAGGGGEAEQVLSRVCPPTGGFPTKNYPGKAT